MKNYKDKECNRQQRLITTTTIFDNIEGGGRFMGKERPFVLTITSTSQSGKTHLNISKTIKSGGGVDSGRQVMCFPLRLPV